MKTLIATFVTAVLSFASVGAATIDVDATVAALASNPAPVTFASIEASLRA
ncbi:hypothetical protein [Polymorphobacter fuscus]|uniref:hypothetical protein n=1 Tax=Sandarakinorhabdus fusca TaxID=1439888 RepID=UPI00129682CB|nr:hypothetical protein [Polymorphobacter fuscus]NJC08645.1 hypothetical protein [Polymorphobacter fuscus]